MWNRLFASIRRTTASGGRTVKAHSHLRFIRRELLPELLSPHNQEKWVHNPLLNFSIQTKVEQIASVKASA